MAWVPRRCRRPRVCRPLQAQQLPRTVQAHSGQSATGDGPAEFRNTCKHKGPAITLRPLGEPLVGWS